MPGTCETGELEDWMCPGIVSIAGVRVLAAADHVGFRGEELK